MKTYIKEDTNYAGRPVFLLIVDDVCMGSISEKNLNKFRQKGIKFDDSEGIKNYIKYNNL